MFKSEESYPEVPLTESCLSLNGLTCIGDDSAAEANSPLSNGQTVDDPVLVITTDSGHTSTLTREHHTLSTISNRSPSPRIFVQSASTQSTLSIASTDAAFLAPRPAPNPPALPGAAQNMSLTFVPFFRRVEEREVIACQICLDEEPLDESVVVQSCGHSFGRECMRSYILSRLDERRFPIPCPCCSAADEAGANPGCEFIHASWRLMQCG
jgi:hypothetical protein